MLKKESIIKTIFYFGVFALIIIFVFLWTSDFNFFNSKQEFVCNNLYINEKIYPALKDVENKLRIKYNPTDIFYEYKKTEVRSSNSLFKEEKVIFCSLPVNVCFTELGKNNAPLYENGSLCMMWKLEIPIFFPVCGGLYKNAKN